MNTVSQALNVGVIPGLLSAVTTSATAAMRGRKDTGSAIAPINATSHVIWGEEANKVERLTVRHTLPNVLINTKAALWWAIICEKFFGASIDRRGASAAMLAGAATAGVVYVLDYRFLPHRLTPGHEHRVSGRSLGVIFGV